MRVLHINGYDYGGGAETVFNYTRNNQNNTENFSGFIKRNTSSGKNSDVNFRLYSTFPKTVQWINYIFSFHNYFALRRFLLNNKIDIIHLHSFIGALSPSILLAIKMIKKKKKFFVIQTMHEFHLICPNSILYDYFSNKVCESCTLKKIKYPVFFKRCDRRGRLYTFLKGARSFLANTVFHQEELIDKIVSPSDFIKKKLIQDNINSSKIVTIRNPIAYIENNSTMKKENVICSFGRFSKEKNLIFLIKAFILWKEKTNNDFKLLLIGEGDTESELRNYVSDSNYKNYIDFKPFLEKNTLFELIQGVKYYSMTSSCYETAPMGIIEAASINLISIVPDIGGMKETIEQVVKVGGIYKSQSLESWCQTMDYLELNYEKLLSQFQANKVEFMHYFSEEAYLKNIAQLYQDTKNELED